MISCQFSLYVLGAQSQEPSIERALSALQRLGLEPEVGPMSTYCTGDEGKVFEGLRQAFELVSQSGHVVMTATVSNACPI